MGCPVSLIVANLFMECFESRALSTFDPPPKFWGRYIDDTATVIKTDAIDPLTTHLNSLHPSIKFTLEKEENKALPMLDTLTKRQEDGSLKFEVFRKKTHTDQYLQFDSHQPMEQKMGVIRTLTHRARTIVSDTTDRDREFAHLQKVLTISGYTKWAWDSPGRKRTGQNRQHSVQKSKGHVTLPYIQGITEPISRHMRKVGIQVHARPHTTIRSILVSPKDKDSILDKPGVVYHLKCRDCRAEYIGETERALRKRVSEHKREASPVGQHLQRFKHELDENIKVLDSDSRWFERGVREAVHIRSRSPSLNRDQGRHSLPPVYDTLVLSHDPLATPGGSTESPSGSCD